MSSFLKTRGDTYRNFCLERLSVIDEIQVTLLELVHKPSRAKIVKLLSNDEENLFSLAFPTYPYSDNGVAHILEHTVLTGSKNFPVHDPFFSMLRRSVATFMNALTGKLWTAYPAASYLEKDYFNLLEIYLDAVFFPNLDKESFWQEGHRLAFADPQDPKAPLVIHGIVYNEMKGAMARPFSRLWNQLMDATYPDNPYGYNSGGDPKAITTLTYEQLVSFHEQYYHPGQCTFFFSGNIPLEKNLDFIGEYVLDSATSAPILPPFPRVKRLTKPIQTEGFYPAAQGEEDCFIAFSWLTTDITNQDEILALSLIDAILMDTDASILRRALMDSKLVIQANSELDTDVPEIPYVLALQGCKEKDADQIEKLLFSTFEDIIEQKIDSKDIKRCLYQMEFERSEITGDGAPYGLDLFYRTVLTKLHGGEPLDNLKIHSQFEKIAKLVEDPNYLPSLIRRYFIDNPHRVRHIMKASSDLLNMEENEEKQNLEAKKEKLSDDEKKEIIDQTKQLEEYQTKQRKQDDSCLPILCISDIRNDVQYYPLFKTYNDRLTVYHHETFTNKITNVDLVFELPFIPDEDLGYLKLFVSILTEVGSGGRSYLETLEYQQAHIGHIGTSIGLNVDLNNPFGSCIPSITISAKALDRKHEHLFQLLRDMILSSDFTDGNRIKDLIAQTHKRLQTRLSGLCASYAISIANASISPHLELSERLSGLTYYRFIDDIATNIKKRLPIVIEKLASISQKIFHLNDPTLIFTADTKTVEALERENYFGLGQLGSTSFEPWVSLPTPRNNLSIAKQLSIPVAHNVLSLKTVEYTDPLSPFLTLASYLFENLVIYNEVRANRGAYGAGAAHRSTNGVLYCYSSRDPNIFSSYQAFKQAIHTVADGLFSKDDLLQAKLGFFQDVDGPVAPGSRGYLTYTQETIGLTKEVRQAYRDLILSAKPQDVTNAVRKKLLPQIANAKKVTFAGDLIKKENEQFQANGLQPLKVEPF